MINCPVIFIHGFVVTARVYGLMGLREYFEDEQLDYHIYKREQGLGVEERAVKLGEFLVEKYGDQPMHLVGHSAGGLDARLCAHLFPALNIKTITTMATPHWGTPIADQWLKRGEECPAVGLLFDVMNDPEHIIEEFTEKSMREFNKRTPDRDDIDYYSLAFYIDKRWKAWSSKSGYDYLVSMGYALNDGTVPLCSQKWGQTIGTKTLYNVASLVATNQGAMNCTPGCHKSESLPFWYGFSKPWKDNFDMVLDNIEMAEGFGDQ